MTMDGSSMSRPKTDDLFGPEPKWHEVVRARLWHWWMRLKQRVS